jgi:hypothetical protein
VASSSFSSSPSSTAASSSSSSSIGGIPTVTNSAHQSLRRTGSGMLAAALTGLLAMLIHML